MPRQFYLGKVQQKHPPYKLPRPVTLYSDDSSAETAVRQISSVGEDQRSNLLDLTSAVVAAFVARNRLPFSELSALIDSVHSTLSAITTGAPASTSPDERTHAAIVAKSITPNYLICLEDGLKFKSMRRHLALLGMTPEQYRRKWKLPSSYPMVAPNYAAARSTLAESHGFGRWGRDTAKASEGAAPARSRRARSEKDKD